PYLHDALPSYRPWDEDAEMPDLRVDAVDDGLALREQVVVRRIDVQDPIQRLLRRSDVVAPGAENADRRADVAEVEPQLAVGRGDLAARELVADEELVDDGGDLLAVHQEVAAPPALELQEARRLGVGLVEKVVVLRPPGVARVHLLEVQHQAGPVEAAVAQVAREM